MKVAEAQAKVQEIEQKIKENSDEHRRLGAQRKHQVEVINEEVKKDKTYKLALETSSSVWSTISHTQNQYDRWACVNEDWDRDQVYYDPELEKIFSPIVSKLREIQTSLQLICNNQRKELWSKMFPEDIDELIKQNENERADLLTQRKQAYKDLLYLSEDLPIDSLMINKVWEKLTGKPTSDESFPLISVGEKSITFCLNEEVSCDFTLDGYYDKLSDSDEYCKIYNEVTNRGDEIEDEIYEIMSSDKYSVYITDDLNENNIDADCRRDSNGFYYGEGVVTADVTFTIDISLD